MAESVSDLSAFVVDNKDSVGSVVVELGLLVVLVVGSTVVVIFEDNNSRRVFALYSAVNGGDLAEVEEVVVLAVLVAFLVGVGGSSNRNESIFSNENPLS